MFSADGIIWDCFHGGGGYGGNSHFYQFPMGFIGFGQVKFTWAVGKRYVGIIIRK